MDTRTDFLIQRALDGLMRGRTTVVIAHRLSTVLRAGQIAYLESGRVVDCAPHDQLLERCPPYRHLFEIQFQRQEPAEALPAPESGGLAVSASPGASRPPGARWPQPTRDVRGTLTHLYRYARPHTWRWLLAGLSLLGVSALQLIPPWVTKTVIDEIIPAGDRRLLFVAAGALVVLHLARGVLAFLNRYVVTWVGQHILFAIGRDLFAHVQRLSLRFYERREAGEIMSRLTNDLNVLQQTLYGSTVSSVVGVLKLVIYFVILMALNWQLTLLVVCTAPAMVVASAVTAAILRPRYRTVQEKAAAVNTVLQENIAGVRVAKAFARESAAQQAFEARNQESMRAALDTRAVQSISGPLVQMIQTFSLCLILWYGGSMIHQGRLTVGELVAFLSYAGAFYQPVNELIQVNNVVQQALAAADRIFQFLDEEPDVVDRPGAIELDRVQGHVRLEGVSFAYLPGQPVLHGIDLEALPGEMVALVGHTGSGKTTIVNLIPRFYDPSDGEGPGKGRGLRGEAGGPARRRAGADRRARRAGRRPGLPAGPDRGGAAGDAAVQRQRAHQHPLRAPGRHR